jgi:hypothetical protein
VVDGVGLDDSQAIAKTLAGLTKQLQGTGGSVLRSAPPEVCVVLFDEVGLQCSSDLVDGLQRVVDGAFASAVVNHVASIAHIGVFGGSQATGVQRPSSARRVAERLLGKSTNLLPNVQSVLELGL